jgi:hypothetical protein
MSGARVACTGLVALGVCCGFGRAALRPDLAVSAASVKQHGRMLRVSEKVRNLGRASVPGFTIGYFLGATRIFRTRIGSLPAGWTFHGSATLTIPGSVAPGSLRLRVCADGRVRESNLRNNCRLAAGTVVVGDITPPRFAGLDRATTCIPGPSGVVRSSPYDLTWEPATDNVTRSAHIVYDIYAAQQPGGEDFATPTYTTSAGATSFTTPPLPDDVGHFFVVRARDAAGNEDENTVERPGRNLCV